MAKSKKDSGGKTHSSASAILQEPLSLIVFIVFALSWIRPKIAGGEVYKLTPGIGVVLFALSCYFTYLYFKAGEKKYNLLGIPALILITTLLFYYSGHYAGTRLERDYTIFSVLAGLFLVAYALAAHRLVKLEVSVVVALFFSTLILHTIPAYTPYLSALDPYFYLKLAESTYKTGFMPEHDYFTYPLPRGIERNNASSPAGLDSSRSAFFGPMFMAYTALAGKPFNITVHNAATLYAAVFSAFTVVMLYLLVRELFSESSPYNRIAAFLAAFILMFSPAYAAKATATNAEDDALGMFLTVTGMLFFVAAFKRGRLDFVYLAGFTFFMLRLSWSGYVYVMVILALFSVLYSVARFLKDESCLNHLTYMFACIIPAYLTPLILHKRGGLPFFRDFFPYNINIVTLGGALIAGILLGYIRQTRKAKKSVKAEAKEKNLLDRINSRAEEHPKLLISSVVVLVIVGLLSFGVDELINVFETTLESRKQDDVIKKTIAEQNALAGSLEGYLAVGQSKFGILFLYAFVMIPVLLYIGFTKADFGSLFVLALSLPMLYGVYFKSQYLFTASVPITVLGATIGLYSIARKEDLESFRVVGTMLVLIVPLVTLPVFGAKYYGNSIAWVPMVMSASIDRYYWDPALQWLDSSTEPNAGVLTWWDYGHWITSISHRPVLIDNLQADPYQIQDVARFFVNKTSEEEAFGIVQAYADKYRTVTEVFPQGVDLRYVVIDWTMIGKGSALHFIATGDIDTKADGSFMNYVQCGFYPDASDRTPRVMTDNNGTTFLGRRIVFACQGYIPGIEFLIKEDRELSEVNVLLGQGQRIPWSAWVKQYDSSLLGVEPLSMILGLAVQRPDEQILEQFRTIVYVPDEFSDFMMTRLYLSDTIDTVMDENFCSQPQNSRNIQCVTYLNQGLYNREYEPLKYFTLVNDFSNGFVRAYRITYPSELGGVSVLGNESQ